MDKNSITGLFLIAGILIGWMFLTKPTAEELARQQATRDSIEFVEQAALNAKTIVSQTAKQTGATDSVIVLSDSAKTALKEQAYGVFANAAEGKSELIVLENDLMKLSINPKGGRIASVELKKYKTFDDKPLILFDSDSSVQNISFVANNKAFSTDSLYFTTTDASFTVSGEESKSISMRLYAGGTDKYIEYIYTLKGNDYMMDFAVNTVGMQNIIAPKNNLILNWAMKTPVQEKNIQTQEQTSTIYYKQLDENADYISESDEETLPLANNVKWVGLKQQFFTSVIIADSSFGATSITTKTEKGSAKYIKDLSSSLTIPYHNLANESFGMNLYFGPNHFKTLKKYDLDLEKQIKLGWKIFGWINRLLTIPIFDFLNSFALNYGIIILILTLIIKALLLPIAYKTILSSAKMRVLKPEIDELNEKHKDDDPMKKQQATMALYKQAGVSPMAGCVPVLLQMPILIALFSFFPASIELRQEAFLWCSDLSTYDSVYNFGFAVPFYGDHVSMFALLMTASTLLYTWSNSQLMGTSNQIPGMQYMMYLMPIMFLGFLNNYSAGLSWYYFLANMITFGQTWFIQKFVIDSDKLHAEIQEHKKKPVKMSKFQEKIEQMAKERQQQSLGQKKKN
jgi:YidC/Oxa1 family membrane protein insertase